MSHEDDVDVNVSAGSDGIVEFRANDCNTSIVIDMTPARARFVAAELLRAAVTVEQVIKEKDEKDEVT